MLAVTHPSCYDLIWNMYVEGVLYINISVFHCENAACNLIGAEYIELNILRSLCVDVIGAERKLLLLPQCGKSWYEW